MRVNKKEAALLNDAIDQWQKENIIDGPTGERLKNSVSTYRNEFDSLTFYSFIAAVSCAILAFGALVMDEKWIERLRNFFQFSELVIGLVFAAFSIFLIWVTKRRKRKYAYATLANESFTILIVLSIGVAVAYFARSFGTALSYYGAAILVTAVFYGLAAKYLQSKILWVCMLVALISSWGAQTYAWSADADQSYFLGMNYPLRMTLMGALLLAATYLLRGQRWFIYFYKLTWYFCWVFFLMSALFLSVSGNLNYEVWSAIKQGQLFAWAIAFTIVMIGLTIFAFKQKDEVFRDIIIIFFLLNIYTRYFEYFWDRTNKGIFFALLALSFWLIGRKAEQLRKKLSE